MKISRSGCRRVALATLGFVALGGAAVAQGELSLPGGHLRVPGSSSTSFPFRSGSTRYQEIHTDLRGLTVPAFQSMAFRRDDRAAPVSTARARTALVEIRMGHGSIERFGSRFDDNYSAPPRVVFASRVVNLPDWTQPSVLGAGVPEPWTVVFPFDAPFSYDAQQDLVWEMLYDQPSESGTFRADRSRGSRSPLYRTSSGQDLGGGCTVAGSASPFSLSATIYSHFGSQLLRIRASTRHAPAGTPVVLNVGLTDPLLSVPGLCATIHADADGILDMGAASLAGSIPSRYWTFPYSAELMNRPLYLQAWALDSTQLGGVSVSNGVALHATNPPNNLPDFAYLAASDVRAIHGEGPFHTGSVTTRWGF